jgi:glycosyltransferase involved in cell wall biosynthesis
MRPALYYPWVYLKGGAERMLLQLMTLSRHDWTLYTNHYDADNTFPEFRDLNVVELSRVSVRRNALDVARAGLTIMRQEIDRGAQHEALIIVSEGLGNLMALRSALPTSCICLTPLKAAYDADTRGQFRKRQALHHLVAARLYARLERPAWARYVRVFCNSRETMSRIERARLVQRERLEVAYHGVDLDRFVPARRREPFFLAAGRITWTKNIELILAAWERFKADTENPYRLVIAGMVDEKSGPYLAALRSKAGNRGDIDWVESPSDDRLIELYQACHAVVFAAPNEDLGLVPLEAMACGKPVIAVAAGGPTETIVHGESGLLCEPTAAAFAGALRSIAFMPEPDWEAMSVYARARATNFGWRPFVDRIDDHIDEVGTASRTDRLAPSARLRS